MKKILLLPLIALAAANSAAAQAPIGPEAAACRANQPSILVNVYGFRRQTGTIRVQLHGSNAATWLGDKTHMKRVELPVTATAMPVCVSVPAPGRYAIAVRHDEDGDRKFTRHDGGGFSRNPSLSITNLKPSYARTSFEVGAGTTRIDVVMNYLQGLSIRPIRRAR